jgi:hypothetical protein
VSENSLKVLENDRILGYAHRWLTSNIRVNLRVVEWWCRGGAWVWNC